MNSTFDIIKLYAASRCPGYLLTCSVNLKRIEDRASFQLQYKRAIKDTLDKNVLTKDAIMFIMEGVQLYMEVPSGERSKEQRIHIKDAMVMSDAFYKSFVKEGLL